MKTKLAEFFGFFVNQLHNPLLWAIVAVIIIAVIMAIKIKKARKSGSNPGPVAPKKPSIFSKLMEPISLWLTLKIERIKISIQQKHQKKLAKRKRKAGDKDYSNYVIAIFFLSTAILIGVFYSEKMIILPLLISVIYFMYYATKQKLPQLPSDFYDDNISSVRKNEMKIELKKRADEGLKLLEIESFLINFIFFFIESLMLFNWEIIRFHFLGEQVILGQSLGVITVILHVVYTICSIKLINPPKTTQNYRGVIKRFGNRFAVVENSLQYIAYLVYSLERQLTLELVEFFPEEEVNIDFVNQDNPAQGKKAPWRILTGGNPKSQDPFEVPANQETYGSYAYAVKDPLWFALKVGSREEARQQIEQTTRQNLEVEYISRSPKEVRLHHAAIVKSIITAIEGLISDWGITFNNNKFVLKLPDPGHTISMSLRDKSNALITKDIEIINAEKDKAAAGIRSEGTKQQLINVGDGNAQAEKAMRVAKAEALQKLMKVLKDNEKALALIAIEKVMDGISKTDKLILGSNGLIDATAIFEKAKSWIDKQTTVTT